MSNEEERARVVAIAHSFLRTPYHHYGEVKGHGVDCLTLLSGVFTEAGLIEPVKLPKYSHQWHLNHSEELYLNGLLQYTHEVEIPLPGDIVVWKFGRCFSHGGIVIDWPTIIHAHLGQNCTLESGMADWLQFIGENTSDRGKVRERKFFSFWK